MALLNPAFNKGDTPGENAPQSSVQNIFSKTFAKKPNHKDKYHIEKNKKLSYIYLGLAILALGLYSVFFFYENITAYLKAPKQIAQANTTIEEYQEVVLPGLEKTRELHKAAYDQEYDQIIGALEVVFPEGIDKLGLIRKLETFATIVNQTNPPFEFTSISLGQPQQQNGYVIVPATTSIHSSLAGFNNFLDLVAESGYIFKDKQVNEEGEVQEREIRDDKIRLMSISNVSIRYRGVDEETGKDEGVDFSVKLNIYSRPE
jgi:hypothetical protein